MRQKKRKKERKKRDIQHKILLLPTHKLKRCSSAYIVVGLFLLFTCTHSHTVVYVVYTRIITKTHTLARFVCKRGNQPASQTSTHIHTLCVCFQNDAVEMVWMCFCVHDDGEHVFIVCLCFFSFFFLLSVWVFGGVCVCVDAHLSL